MDKIKVKTFANDSLEELEQEIGFFIEQNDVTIIKPVGLQLENNKETGKARYCALATYSKNEYDENETKIVSEIERNNPESNKNINIDKMLDGLYEENAEWNDGMIATNNTSAIKKNEKNRIISVGELIDEMLEESDDEEKSDNN